MRTKTTVGLELSALLFVAAVGLGCGKKDKPAEVTALPTGTPAQAGGGSEGADAAAPVLKQPDVNEVGDTAQGDDGGAPDAAATPTDPLDALAAQAMPYRELESSIEKIQWAFLPPGTTDCGGDTSKNPPTPKRLDVPDSSDAFEREGLVAKRASIVKDSGLQDKLVVWSATYTAKPGDSGDVRIGDYDFKSNTYPVVLTSDANSKWPLLGGTPTFSNNPVTLSTKRDTGLRVEGKKVEVRGSEEVPVYENAEVKQFRVKVPVDEAERWQNEGVHVEYTVIQRFKGLGYHKVCHRSCMSIFGSDVCGNDDVGAQEYYRTEPVAHRIRVGGKEVSLAMNGAGGPSSAGAQGSAKTEGGQRAKSPGVRDAAPTITGRVAAEAVQRIVRQNFGRFRLCYENGLTKNPKVQGRVTVKFIIDRTGAVSLAADGGSDLSDPSVVQCVVRGFKNLTFPAPEGGLAQVAYPIIFASGE